MNGPHDLGGQMGFGPVAPEKDEPVFHAEWEKRALGLTLVLGRAGRWNIDESRHARESLHPADYLCLELLRDLDRRAGRRCSTRHGFVSARRSGGRAGRSMARRQPKRVLKAADVPAALARGGPCDRPVVGAGAVQGGRPRADAATSTRPATRACRAMRAASRGWSRRCARVLSSRTRNAHGRGRDAAMGLHRGVRRTASCGATDAQAGRSPSAIDAWESYLEPA